MASHDASSTSTAQRRSSGFAHRLRSAWASGIPSGGTRRSRLALGRKQITSTRFGRDSTAGRPLSFVDAEPRVRFGVDQREVCVRWARRDYVIKVAGLGPHVLLRKGAKPHISGGDLDLTIREEERDRHELYPG